MFKAEDYREPGAALFEIQILMLLEEARNNARKPFSVNFYPKIPGTNKIGDALIHLAHKKIFIEATLLSQTEGQERRGDIGLRSCYENVVLTESEKKQLGIRSAKDGVVTGVGDPYRDALRVIRKLDEERKQLAPQHPNIICLARSDLYPSIVSVEWASENIFSGESTMAHMVLSQNKLLLDNRGATMPVEESEKIEREIKTLEQDIRNFKAIPQLSGILYFDWGRRDFTPKKTFRNPTPGPSNGLEEDEWEAILEIFGF